MNKDARFYFGNLLADIVRSAMAAEKGDEARYADSVARTHKTLAHLRTACRPEAYEEGLLLTRALSHAKARGTIHAFRARLAPLMRDFAAIQT